MQMTMRDVYGRSVRIPDGRPGLVLFVTTSACRTCVDAVRTAARAATSRASLTVISVDAATTREDISRLAAAAGRPRARYVVDDRSSSLASMFGVSSVGHVAVYDRQGAITGRPETSASALRRALDRASR